MCGLTGFVTFARADYDADAILQKMNRRLTHRGPDAEGYMHLDNVHFAHRRLSVIDIAASTQPMVSSDSRHTLIFNGEIYNYLALRAELETLGAQFRTNGDTEVVLTAIAQWGDAALTKFQGMFALACFDNHTKSMLLARDHLGVKPLHITWDGRTFCFASELKAITAHPAVPLDVDLDAIGLFLECQYIPAPLTIYKSIRKLEAGHALRLNTVTAEIKQWQYWKPSFANKLDVNEAEATDELDTQLRKSVKSMLVADVPLGAFVSGGIDSSLIAALMTDITGKPIETFNLGFLNNQGQPDTTQSEHDEAQQVATHLGSNHHQLMVSSNDVTSAFHEWVNVFDEPFGDQAALPTMLLSKLTRRHVTVALTGEGADELFSGYSNYQKRVREEKISALLGGSYSPLPAMLRTLPAAARRDRLVKAILQPPNKRYATIPNIFDVALQPKIYSDQLLNAQETHIADYAARFFDECDSTSYIEKIMYVDTKLWLPDDLLTKVDRATMAYSLEARVPYLDHKFVEFVASLPAHFKQRDKVTKYLLKKLAVRYLPKDIVYRPKQGFVMPLAVWLAGDLKPHVDAALGPQGLQRRGLFRDGALAKLQADHALGRHNNAGRIWALTILEQWFTHNLPTFSL